MNQSGILQQYSLAQTIVQAYENWLKQTVLNDQARAELAIQAMTCGTLTRTKSEAVVVQNSMSSYVPSSGTSKMKKKTPTLDGWSQIADDMGNMGDTRYDFPHITEDKIDADIERIKEGFDKADPDNPGYVAPFGNTRRPEHENDFDKWVGDHIGPGFEKPLHDIAASWQNLLGGDAEISAETIAGWLNECIPCMERFKDIAKLRPLDDILQLLDQDFARRLNLLDMLASLFNNTEIVDDICSLAKFLNFQCIPDIVTMIAVLKALLAKILDSFKFSLAGAIWALIGALLYPFFQGFMDLIKHYMDVLLAPIECILDSIVVQMSKIPGLQDETMSLYNWRKRVMKEIKKEVMKKVQNQPNPEMAFDPNRTELSATGNYFDKTAPSMKLNEPRKFPPAGAFMTEWGFLDYLNTALGYLFYYLSMGVKFITDFILYLEKSIKEVIGGDFFDMGLTFNNAQNMLRISRLIGLLLAMIRFMRGGAFCPGEDQDYISMTGALAEYSSSMVSGFDFAHGKTQNGEDAIFIISPEDKTAGIIRDNWGNQVGELSPDKKVLFNTTEIKADRPRDAKPLKNGKKIVIVDSCMKKPPSDIKVQKWVNELQGA